MENLHALIVDCRVTQADKNNDTKWFVGEKHRIGVTLHVIKDTNNPGGSAIDSRTKATGATPNRSMPVGALNKWVKCMDWT